MTEPRRSRAEDIRFRPGQVAVFRPGGPVQRLESTRVDLPVVKPRSEVWRGPEQELRARLRDEARDMRVKPFGDTLDMPGLPRGWAAMRVYFTEYELSRDIKPKRRVWPWIAIAITASLTGVGFLGYWLYLQIAAAVAGILTGGGTALLIVLALLLLAGGSTTVVTIITQVTVRRSWW